LVGVRKVADMKATIPIESHPSPAPEIIPEPPLVPDETAASTRRGSQQADGTTTGPAARRTPLARLLAALRGDKYMVDAYPPAEAPAKEG
jgi:hypothetical protein